MGTIQEKDGSREFHHYGNKPEVDGIEGFKDQVICMAAFESASLNRPVSMKDVEDCKIESYQKEINDYLGV